MTTTTPKLAPSPEFRRLERSWIRLDPNGDHPRVTGRDDLTPCRGTNPPTYDSRCPSCWLGHQHSTAWHAQEIGEVTP